MQNRAYSILDVKSFDDERRIFRGIATTPSVDRVGDIIEPEGVRFANPMPLLHQHRHDAPIGSVKFSKPTKAGIEFEAEIPIIAEPGPLKDRVDTAWLEVRHGLVKATSIGFKPVEYSFMDNGGIRYSQVEVYELSTVTVPANADARITTIKAYDREARIAAGIELGPIPELVSVEFGDKSVILPPSEPAASGKKVRVVKLDERPASEPFVVRRVIRT